MFIQSFINPLILPKIKLNHYSFVKLYYDDDKLHLTSKNEPKEFFMTNLNKFQDPIVLLSLFSIFFPFFLLLSFWNYIEKFYI